MHFFRRIAVVIPLSLCIGASAESNLFTRSGTFPTGAGAASGWNPTTLITADINRDGYADLVTVNAADQTLTVLLGDGRGNFTATPSGPINVPFPTGVAASDVNGDGNPDLVITGAE